MAETVVVSNHAGTGHSSVVHGVERLNLIEDRSPRADETPRGRERLEQRTAILLRDDARIDENDDAAVARRSDESPEPLLHAQRGVRQHVLPECIAATTLDRFAVRRGQRIARYLERQFG